MKVGDIMAQGAATIRLDAELREAAKLMVARGLRGLPVVNETGCAPKYLQDARAAARHFFVRQKVWLPGIEAHAQQVSTGPDRCWR
jgi:hypothetical protein